MSLPPLYYDRYLLLIDATPRVFSKTGTFIASYGPVASPLPGIKAVYRLVLLTRYVGELFYLKDCTFGLGVDD